MVRTLAICALSVQLASAVRSNTGLESLTVEQAASDDVQWAVTPGTSQLDMQEAGFRLLNGAARHVWRRSAPTEGLPSYTFGAFSRYVPTFVALWREMGFVPECADNLAKLESVVTTAARDLMAVCSGGHNCTDDGVPRLPKVTTDKNIKKFVQDLHIPTSENGVGFFTQRPPFQEDFRKEEGAPDCAHLPADLRRRFCGPADGQPGWRFWFEEWLPALTNAFSCGYKEDEEALASWQWLAGNNEALGEKLVRPKEWTWDLQKFLVDPEVRAASQEGDEELLFKIWRLNYRYLTKYDKFNFERVGTLHQKELARFVPFVGEYLDRRPLNCIWTSPGVKPSMESIPSNCNAQFFTLFYMMATERQTFYGPMAWRFFHTTAEVAAAKGEVNEEAGMAVVRLFQQFLPLFGLMHNCPHCREHFLTKVQYADFISFHPEQTLESHRYRNFGSLHSLHQVSDEVLLYPIEWLMLVGGNSQVLGSAIPRGAVPLDGWKVLSDPTVTQDPSKQSISTRLSTVQRSSDLRIFLWKLHNAVDSSLESKFEERVLPVPAGYWPVSRFYSYTEPWGLTGREVSSSWQRFRVSFLEGCWMEAGSQLSGGSEDAELFTLMLLPEQMDGMEAADQQELKMLLDNRVHWRFFALALQQLVTLLHVKDPEPSSCAAKLAEPLSNNDAPGFCSAVRAALNVCGPQGCEKNTCDGQRGIGSVKSSELADAAARWLCDWTRMSRLVKSLETMVSCASQSIVDSNLLQTKFGPV